ncbi:MAG: hypothetical protein RDV00_09390 [Clostridia bacterium]|nr:hypothetical protein [Clostridia bacterium]MDQ7792316.1 hypothetical protein [Clostridia bacterium]
MYFSIVLFILAIAGLVASWRRDRKRTRQALKITYKGLGNMLPLMLGVIFLRSSSPVI